MTTPILLTPHQCDAVSFVVEKLSDGEQLVAIRGLAGTGKTSLIPSLRDLITSTLDVPTAVGSPTHRAAMILRKKGIADAGTIHTLALTPYFLGDYAWAHRWLGEDCPARAGAIEERTPDVGGVPHLLHSATDKPKGLMQRVRRHGVKKVLASLGIHGKDYFDGFGSKQGEGVLIVDEASMVGEETLKLCQDAFPQIVLIGDPGQLPPVKDHSRLAEVVGFNLTEVHRQAADNPIITLAYEARTGTPNWKVLPLMDGKINQRLVIEDPAVFLYAPLLVWRNETRLECTKGIRAALGYWQGKVYPGEPLVCRSTSAADRAEGLLNNSLWRVVEVHKGDARRVTLAADGDETQTVEVIIHIEDVDGDEVPEEAVPFRYGYCLTAHTAQGGEWPTVYISKPDLLAHQAFCTKRKTDEHAQWSYTAITRAKDTLVFLQEHRFLVHEDTPQVNLCAGDTLTQPMKDVLTTLIEHAKEESMPIVMTADVEQPTLQVPTKAVEPLAPLTGDIDDPPVPEGTTDALEAFIATPVNGGLPPTVPGIPESLVPLAHGFCQYVQAQLNKQLEDAGIKMARSMDTTITDMANYTKGVLATSEHANYSFADALAKITQTQAPYSVVVHAVTPNGLPCTLTMHKPTSSELIEELGRMESWMIANGYTAQEVAA